MKKALALALAFSAGVFVSAFTGEAGVPVNGAHMNGMPFNGMPFQGLNFNGIVDNGIIDNGLSGTYLDFTTISHHGLGK
jgi:hypothetical protein